MYILHRFKKPKCTFYIDLRKTEDNKTQKKSFIQINIEGQHKKRDKDK